MRFIPTMFGLIAAASAIDVRLNANANCRDAVGLVCTRHAPDVCCGQEGVTAASVSAYFIPVDWRLTVRGHDGGWCRGLKQSDNAINTNFKCLQNGPFSGGGYGFIAKKKRGADGTESTPANCRKPDTMQMAGGTQFDLVNMEDGAIKELWEFAKNKTTIDSLPAKFLPYEKKKPTTSGISSIATQTGT